MDLGDRTGSRHLPGAALSRDIARGESVEHEIDSFISKRHRDRVATEGERQAEEHWEGSERAYFARRDEEMRVQWCEYHQGQAARHRAVLEALIAEHEEQAEKYRQLTKGVA